VHSPMETDVRRGRALAQELLAGKQLEERSEHDCIYLLSVALYRAGRLLDARRQLDELLKVRAPGWAHHVHRVSSAGSSTRQFWCVSAECLRPTPDTGCVRRKRGKAPPHRRSRPTLHQGTYHARALCARVVCWVRRPSSRPLAGRATHRSAERADRLQVNPGSRQGAALKSAVEDQIVRCGHMRHPATNPVAARRAGVAVDSAAPRNPVRPGSQVLRAARGLCECS